MNKMVKFNLGSFALSLAILAFLLYMQWFWVITAFAVFWFLIELMVFAAVKIRISRIESKVDVTEDDKKFLEQMITVITSGNAEFYSILKSIIRAVIGVGLISQYGMIFTGSLYLGMLILARIRYQSIRNLFLNA